MNIFTPLTAEQARERSGNKMSWVEGMTRELISTVHWQTDPESWDYQETFMWDYCREARPQNWTMVKENLEKLGYSVWFFQYLDDGREIVEVDHNVVNRFRILVSWGDETFEDIAAKVRGGNLYRYTLNSDND